MTIKYKCEYCGSSNITFTANAHFNEDTQEFEIADVLDEAFCNNCEKEIDSEMIDSETNQNISIEQNDEIDEDEKKLIPIFKEKVKHFTSYDHDRKVICGHLATVIQQEDAYCVLFEDGLSDVCCYCFERIADPKWFFNQMAEISNITEWVFKGTKQEFIDKLKMQKKKLEH